MKMNPSFVLREIYHTFLLVPIRKNSISKDVIALNDTAAMIFQKCEKAESAHTLAEILAEEFLDIPAEEVIGKLEPYIETLIEQKLLVGE
ncbi:MAG: PqqD family protein [Lachnospiraceae bacterium]|nr:PqqD family protein [Lachnospiraceae bacterium]